MVKNLPEMKKTWIKSPGWENPLEEGMATQSSFLAWRIPGMGEPWWAEVYGVAQSRTRLKRLNSSSSSSYVTAAMKLKDTCTLEEKL